MTKQQLLTTKDMANFAARGFLRFDNIVPDSINRLFLDDIRKAAAKSSSHAEHNAIIMKEGVVPLVTPGTPFSKAYPTDSALGKLVALPQVDGAIASLVGADCILDHQYLHMTFPPEPNSKVHKSQPNHQDSTIDPRRAFDIQLFYFPHEVTAEMGGTRFVPGTHFRIVSEFAIARYQNMRGQLHTVCPAGSVMLFHMGLWHGAGLNLSDQPRYMFKIRLCPTSPQLRLWDTKSTNPDHSQGPIFWTDRARDPDNLRDILTKPEPWFEDDTEGVEYIHRIRFWRYISGDSNFDANYWVTRIENEYH